MNYTTFGILIFLFFIILMIPVSKKEQVKNTYKKKVSNRPSILTNTHDFAKYFILKN
jgi:hypothetical protein